MSGRSYWPIHFVAVVSQTCISTNVLTYTKIRVGPLQATYMFIVLYFTECFLPSDILLLARIWM